MASHEDDLVVVITETTDGIVAMVSGEIDLSTAARLRDALVPHIGPDQRLVLDLSDVAFMDSTCLSVLVETNSELRERQGQLIVRNPSPAAKRVMAITELEHVFEDFDDV